MTIKIILKWIIGIILLLAALVSTTSGDYMALILIPLSLFIIPLSYEFLIEEKANLKLTSKTKWVVSFTGLLLVISVNLITDFLRDKDQNTSGIISKNNDGRDTQIENTKYYLENDYKKVTDSDGIAYELKVEKNEVSRKKMYESEKIYFEKGSFIVVSSYKTVYDFRLLSNGELKDVIQYEGYLIDSKRSDRNDLGAWCRDYYTYIPELDKENKKRIISDFTGGNCGMGEEINNVVKKNRIAAVKACGILEDK